MLTKVSNITCMYILFICRLFLILTTLAISQMEKKFDFQDTWAKREINLGYKSLQYYTCSVNKFDFFKSLLHRSIIKWKINLTSNIPGKKGDQSCL